MGNETSSFFAGKRKRVDIQRQPVRRSSRLNPPSLRDLPVDIRRYGIGSFLERDDLARLSGASREMNEDAKEAYMNLETNEEVLEAWNQALQMPPDWQLARRLLERYTYDFMGEDADEQLVNSDVSYQNDGATLTALHIAVYVRDKDAVSMLLEYNADPNISDSYGHTPLQYVQDAELVGILIDAGAAVSAAHPLAFRDFGLNKRYRNPDVVAALLDRRVNTTQHMATEMLFDVPNEAVLRVLLDRGANILEDDPVRRTPVIWAIKTGRADAALAMLRMLPYAQVRGDGVDMQSEPLWWAIISPHSDSYRQFLLLVRLIQRGVSQDMLDRILEYAILHVPGTLYDILLQNNANIDRVDPSNGWTPIFNAIRLGNGDAVRRMIRAGANLSHRDNNGRTPWDIADPSMAALMRSEVNRRQT